MSAATGTRASARCRALGVAAVLLVGGALASGCGGASAGTEDIRTYVALGDSYTAGAGTAVTPVAGAAGGCGQVPENYPRLVAKALSADLVDASCGGATTGNVTVPQPRDGGESWPPQLGAVSRGTDLVTVGLGFNDANIYGDSLFGCTDAAAADPTGSPCRDTRLPAGTDPATLPDEIGDNLAKVLEVVHAKAPDARLVVVGYPQLVPDDGTCAQLPLATGDYAFVRDRLDRLDRALRHAAEDAGATYVDVMAASAGHDICAGADAWVNGPTAQAGVALAYHPFASEQHAVADLVVDALRR